MEEQRALVAAQDGDLATLEQLLEAGALGPGITDALGAGLVHHAARAGHLACVKFLVQRAQLPGNQRAHNGATPAHDAAATGSLAELCWLVRDGGCGLQVSGNGRGGPIGVQGDREMRVSRAKSGAVRPPWVPRPWAASPKESPRQTLGTISGVCLCPTPSPSPQTKPRMPQAPPRPPCIPRHLAQGSHSCSFSPCPPPQKHVALPGGV